MFINRSADQLTHHARHLLVQTLPIGGEFLAFILFNHHSSYHPALKPDLFCSCGIVTEPNSGLSSAEVHFWRNS
jgi:hypothetical protein